MDICKKPPTVPESILQSKRMKAPQIRRKYSDIDHNPPSVKFPNLFTRKESCSPTYALLKQYEDPDL